MLMGAAPKEIWAEIYYQKELEWQGDLGTMYRLGRAFLDPPATITDPTG